MKLIERFIPIRLLVLGFVTASIGAISNIAVIWANEGWMPVLASGTPISWHLYRDARMAPWNTRVPLGHNVVRAVYYPAQPPRLTPLADRFYIRTTISFLSGRYSFGDLLIYFGATLGVACLLLFTKRVIAANG